MKKVLYIGSLNTSNEKYDGERIKTTLIYTSLKKKADVTVINLSTHKFFNTLRIVFNSLFKKKKYDFIFISKDSHGANIIQKILIKTKYPLSKVVYFEIGPFLYERIVNGEIGKETFINDRFIVVETESMKRELDSLGFERIKIIPNFKPIIGVPFNKQTYPKKTLNLVYFSRIEDKKGIYDLIESLANINSEEVKFNLDVFGRPQNKNEERRIKQLANEYSFVNYCGAMDTNSEESYKLLSTYDLHVFPTKYGEGFPGTIIDFFIAGVPTLASTFLRADDILTRKDSLLFEQGNNGDLINKLLYIYENQEILSSLRENSFARRHNYSVEKFEEYLDTLLGELDE